MLLKLIEVYQMAQELEKTWVGNVLTPEEVKQYAVFESELKERFTTEEKVSFEQSWDRVVEEINTHLDQDPKIEAGFRIGKYVMNLINGLYGKKHANLKRSIWEKGFKEGQIPEDHLLKPQAVSWLNKAIDNYYRTRIYDLVDKMENTSSSELDVEWAQLMEEMFGDSKELKEGVILALIQEGRGSEVVLKRLRKAFSSY